VNGGMAEWLKAAVLKTVDGETRPGVRIPLPPPLTREMAPFADFYSSLSGSNSLRRIEITSLSSASGLFISS
jgi:hypothetical protein